MNDKDAALMRSWAEVALRNEGIDHRRDIVARFVMDSVDDPYGDIEVGSVWIARFEGEERVAVRGETKWYLCETDGYIPQEGEVVELVSKLVPEDTSEATDRWCREAAEILRDEKPEHPEVLITEEDYKNAPVGTIVAGDFCDPWVKDDLESWSGCGASEASPEVARPARRVLRWSETR